jgi:hypothetical protein
MKPEEKSPIRYRSFYAEMKRLEKPERVTAFAAVQNASNSAAATSYSVTVSSTTANNLLVVLVRVVNTSTLSSVTDNAGNTYSLSFGYIDFSTNTRLYQAYGVQTTGGATSVTITQSTGSGSSAIVNEYSGFAAGNTNATVYDAGVTGTGTGTSISTSTLTPSSTGNLIVCSIRAVGTGIAAGSGYTIYGTQGATHAMMYKLSSGSSETCPATCTSGDWGIIGMSFRDTPPASGNGRFFYFF